MNLLTRIFYFFSYFFKWFVDCWKWVANLVATNPLLQEILVIFSIFLIASIALTLIIGIFDRF